MDNFLNLYEKYRQDCQKNIDNYSSDLDWKNNSKSWLINAFYQKYMYNFSWLGRPIIQLPNDILNMQELIWNIKPDLIIETGIAHGGSLIMNASMLALVDICESIESGENFNPCISKRKVLGIDIDIRLHNRAAIEQHPMSSRIQMIQGSSIEDNIVNQVYSIVKNYNKVLVLLDSNHTHEHVLAELNVYAPLTSIGSYCIVFDTIVEDMPKDVFPDRPWGPGDNPKTAVWEYLKSHPEFEIDTNIENKLMITVAPNGFLKRKY